MYTVTDYKTKKALKEALLAGTSIEVYQPGPFANGTPNGKVYLEGPHYPKPHTWYASGIAVDGVLVQVDNVKRPVDASPLGGLTVGDVLRWKVKNGRR